MPIYEYECSSCGHRFEKLVKIGAEPPPCPECAAAEVRKRISASGFILKGGGWYKDHYGLKGGGSSAEKASSSSEKASSSEKSSSGESSTKSESSGSKDAGAKTTTTPAPAAK